MPRTKNIAHHTDLAKSQVSEALALTYDELMLVRSTRDNADARMRVLNAEFVKLRDAAVSLGLAVPEKVSLSNP